MLVMAPAATYAQSEAATTTAAAAAAQDDLRMEAELARLEAEAARLDAINAGTERGEVDGPTLGAQLVKMIIMLTAVCLLAYLLLGRLLPKLMQLNPAVRHSMTAMPPRGLIAVVDRLSLDPKRTVYVIRVGEELFLVGVTEQGMNMLSKLVLEDLPVDDKGASALGGLSRFASLLTQRPEKES